MAVQTPLMITSSGITKSDLHIFRSNYIEQFSDSDHSDREVCLRDAIVASCAAPTFFAPKNVNPHLLADGGLWANNPSIAALTEAVTYFNKQPRHLKIISIGTGHSISMYQKKSRLGVSVRVGRCKVNFLCNDLTIACLCKYGETFVERELSTC